MSHPRLDPKVAPFGPLSALLLPALNQMTPRRVTGWAQPEHLKAALSGETNLCPVLDRVLSTMLAAPHYPTDALLLIPSLTTAYIRRVRAALQRERPLTFAEACQREQAAHCALDPLQMQALASRSPGDVHALLPGLAAQIAATEDLILASITLIAVAEGRGSALAA